MQVHCSSQLIPEFYDLRPASMRLVDPENMEGLHLNIHHFVAYFNHLSHL